MLHNLSTQIHIRHFPLALSNITIFTFAFFSPLDNLQKKKKEKRFEFSPSVGFLLPRE